ncbi:hypothetical protein C8C83_3725 [Flavobacterium sp. 90]|nr:hypothetical protein C8C82_4045 [Flavobacterium sp. 81]TCK55740.1 hypothetical protein C8C83_3725 [Flavobacterium sp. 90]
MHNIDEVFVLTDEVHFLLKFVSRKIGLLKF